MPYVRLCLANNIHSDNVSPIQHFVLSIKYLTLWLLTCIWEILVCWDSSVDIATRYGLNSSGIEARWGQDFPRPSTPALGLTQLPIQWLPGQCRW